jgi:hypothetical protein
VEGSERKGVFKKLRKWLKAGSWRKVVRELMSRTVDAEDARLPKTSPVWTEIAYLERHGEAGHLDYARYRRRGLPQGSGAIESAVRRVINLRMKGNSIFWKEENADAMLTLRGLVLSGRSGLSLLWPRFNPRKSCTPAARPEVRRCLRRKLWFPPATSAGASSFA